MKTLPEILLTLMGASKDDETWRIFQEDYSFAEAQEAIAKELMGCLPEKKKLRNYNPDKDLTEAHHTQIMVQNMGFNQALDEVRARLTAFIGKEKS